MAANTPEHLQFWATPGSVTEVDRAGPGLEGTPADVAGLRRTSCNLVFHYRGGGDFAANGIDPARIAEIDTRYADVMLERLRELAGPSLTEPRSPAERLVGCCRDFTVLYVALARHHGLPARARVGFATYFERDWYIDHVIAEVWDAGENRWRLVEPQVSDEFAERAGFDPLDVPPPAFLTAGEAWLRARAGDLDAERFVVSSDLQIPATRGWRQLRHHLVHDLASLDKEEMVLWDQWGLVNQYQPPDERESAMLDDLAVLTASADPALSAVRDWAGRAGIAVPATVTSYSPARQEPVTVELRHSRTASGG